MKRQSPALEDLNYLVVGLGLSGYSAARFLLANGFRCRVQDTRDLPPYLGQLKSEFEAVEVNAGELSRELIGWADALVVSPGISVRSPALRAAAELGRRICGDVELFAQLAAEPVVAITGSNGKSTVTTLVGDMIRADSKRPAVGGNLGTPALDLLGENPDYYVLELSSYQLETTFSLKPRIASLLNLCEDHLDRYPGYADYVAAKRRIYSGAQYCVSNFDDDATWHDLYDIRFSLDPRATAEFRPIERDGWWLGREDEPWLGVDELKVSGRHNWANALAAMAIAHRLGISRAAIVAALRNFGGIPHRSQWVAEIDGVEWINDSKATNVGAARASIEGRERPVILIAGGQSKGADMSALRDVMRSKVRLALLLGEDAALLQQAWQDVTRVERVADMAAAVTRAQAAAEPGDCVLLAPACASFDMYEKFEHRGEDFMQRVRELADG